ncbi:HlyD family type I secretion periplasmic adaptor subunit [Candidatus Magnetaquicoccus inordinatus]|uniref:HlyD family type I secretion periplasmic adaptor subunit n=1 Tax=Candidatus Magnetaquicoccus inordinatus TaxID=2496818 RepID=UPI00102BC38D|nr:HlyD family type I secretion periplasmic adaptor subunit [Candidatus Magnetaquicoccus inordinatus]
MNEQPALPAAGKAPGSPLQLAVANKTSLPVITYQRNRYLAQSVLFEESELPRLLRSALLLISVALILFCLWASSFSLDEMTHASGQVIAAAPVQRIQHLEGGIVQEILVKERQIVQEGEILVRLDTHAALTALQQVRSEQATLLAWQARLRAFLDDNEADYGKVSAEFVAVLKSQQQLLQAQRQARQSQRLLLQAQAESHRLEQEQLRGMGKFFSNRIRLVKEEKASLESGLRSGATSRQDLIRVEQQLNDAESELQRNHDLQSKAEKAQQEILLDLAKREDELREKAQGELSKVTADLSKVEEGLMQNRDRVARLEVRSPVHGIVQEMPVKTVRGVLAPGATIAEIVPIGPVRYVEARIRTLDVGHLAVGQRVTVNVLAYDYARYGGIEGTLESISPTTFQEGEGKEPYYKALVRLHKDHVGSQAKVNEVLPGMVVQADIHTGAKTLMEYLLKPIYASIDQAFRER